VTRRSGLRIAVAIGFIGLAACGRTPGPSDHGGVNIQGAADAASTPRGCENVPPPGKAVSATRVLAPNTRLIPPAEGYHPSIDAASVANGADKTKPADVRCVEVLLGRFVDDIGKLSVPAWAVVYSKFGRMVPVSDRTDYPLGYSPRPIPEVNYEIAVIVDATSGKHITTLEYPTQ